MRLTLVDRDVDGDTFFPHTKITYEKSSRTWSHQEYNTGFSFVDYVPYINNARFFHFDKKTLTFPHSIESLFAAAAIY